MYGSDNENVRMAREDLRAIRERSEASLFDPPCASEVDSPIGEKEGSKRWKKYGQQTLDHWPI
jgi:hypothetical protein